MSTYKDLKLKRIKALYQRASSLFYGTDVKIGGDWCQTKDCDKEMQAHQIIALLYDEISPYKEEILSDTRTYEVLHPNILCRWGDEYDTLCILQDIIKSYEDDTQYVLDIEKKQKTLPEDLLKFIKYKKQKEFSTLLQTIIDNNINNGIERAAITYIIYESSLFNSSQYHEWKPFYEQFCTYIGWKITTYKPNRLTNTIKELKRKQLWVDEIK